MTDRPPVTTWHIAVGDDVTRAVHEPAVGAEPGRAPDTLFVCAHGAGGSMDDGGVRAAANGMRRVGVDVVRFNFVYREQGSKRPDPMPRLQACVAAVAEHARAQLKPRRLILGGRSMGGRAASMWCADKADAGDGLLLLAYPLHPAGQPEKLRDAHLARIRVPVLCFNGTRDALCTVELMERAVAPLAPRWTMHWLDGADHSFHVLKSSGRTDADVIAEVGGATRAWLDAAE